MRITVIIPVYGAFEYTWACLESVVRHTDPSVPIILIDDCAPAGDLLDFLRKNGPLPKQVSVLRNPGNMGFVASCNRALRECLDDDVVLLNSDTEVTPRWLEKLRRAAYSGEDVGTVTPFTNNGVICSFPKFCEDNALPNGLALDEYSEIIESAAKPFYPTLPTAVGFCMFIKREVIKKVGLLDEENFGLGYGEENDFCCRAQAAGYRDILDDATFVYHKGSMSFQESKKELGERNSKILAELHPHYFAAVAAFCSADPLLEIRERIWDRIFQHLTTGKRGHLLHIVHNGPYKPHFHTLGGTELHVQDLIENSPEFCHWSLICSQQSYFLTAHLYGLSREFVFEATNKALVSILSPLSFDLIHVHHTRFFPFEQLVEALVQHGNYVVSLHDFYMVCPRTNLLRVDYKMCGGHECTTTCGYDEDEIKNLRLRTRVLLSKAKRTFAFSRSTRSLYFNIIADDSNFSIKPHGLPQKTNGEELERYIQDAPARPGENSPLKLLFLGHLAPHKGSELVARLSLVNELSNGIPVEWHLLGKFHGEGARLIEHGEYTRAEVTEKIVAIKPHLTLMLAICPETYSLSVDESLNAGVPVLASPFGAPAERLRSSGAGWVLPIVTFAGVMQQLAAISEDWVEYWIVRQNIRRAAVSSAKEMGEGYLSEYRSLVKQRDAHDLSDFDFVARLEAARVVEEGQSTL